MRDTIEEVVGIELSTVSGFRWPVTFTAEPGELEAATLTPASDVVGADTSITLALTTKHRIPRKGKIVIGVSEFWNVGSENEMYYFSSVTCSDFTVGGVAVTAAYVCSFLDGSRVELDGGFMEQEVPANTEISVRILGFRNPILANAPFDVFTVNTTDEDSSNVVDFLAASVTVT